jgi:hypothetical protein
MVQVKTWMLNSWLELKASLEKKERGETVKPVEKEE